jgi:hypothetical protein
VPGLAVFLEARSILKLNFTKMPGAGNDFIQLDGVSQQPAAAI